MELIQGKTANQVTPLNPSLPRNPPRREPPCTIPIKSKFQSSLRTPVFSKTSNPKCQTEENCQSELNSPKLPIVCIRNTKTPIQKSRNSRYSKYLPRVLDLKPVFQERGRSYIPSTEEPEDLKINRNRLTCIDFQSN